MIAGVVLAGGLSTRFGSEKAAARLGPAPLVAHAAAVLANGCGVVAVNAPASSRAAAWAQGCGLPVAPDRKGARQGPVAGVLAALDWAIGLGVEFVAVAPCDCPALPRDLVARLIAGLAPGAGAAAAHTRQGPEPACAVWRVTARPAVEAALAGGAEPSLRSALAAVNATSVAFEEAAAFADVDTRAALDALAGDGGAARWWRAAAAGGLRATAAVLLCTYALGGLVLAAVLAVASDFRAQALPHGWRMPMDRGAVEVSAVGLVWFALVLWAVPRLLAPAPPRAAARVSPPWRDMTLTSRPARRI